MPRKREPKARAPQPAFRRPLPFPVVGIGASAGGLEAFETFLRHLPKQTGMAFVIVQHLDPTHKGMLVELLQRVTPMTVLQIRDRLKVEPNRVYVIPPNKDLSVLHGVFRLVAPAAPRGQRLPIDFFFKSLAADQGSRGIGVILSGMGSDGTLGLSALREKGGTVLVQDPASAKFDSMPKSAIDAGLADLVAPVDELAQKLTGYVVHASRTALPETPLAAGAKNGIEQICVLLRNQTGHDFSHYKRSSIFRRIERRMSLHQSGSITDYLRYMRENPQEGTLLFKELLIGVTSFFRDPEAWEHLQKVELPALLAERPAGGVLRAWVAGCSTGEEAYSLAIVFKEALAELQPAQSHSLQIFATDLDKDSIARARQGSYPTSIAGDVSARRLERFFVRDERGYRVSQEIRESVVFAIQNVIMDPPFTKLDILSCRNLLIYLTPELQAKLLPLFHYSLRPGGILFLGSAETLGGVAELFTPKSSKTRIYRRPNAPSRDPVVDFPASSHGRRSYADPSGRRAASTANLQTQAAQLLLDRYAPAAVLTNQEGDILYVSGRTGKYLEPAAGKANWNIHAMAREGMRHELGRAFQKALRSPRGARRLRVRLRHADVVATVDVTVELLNQPRAMRGMVMLVFADVAASPAEKPAGKPGKTSLAARLALELEHDREELRSIREEMQSSQEELKSANEDLQSTIEELQSTNEELTTSKEEMQSLNEELQTLNHELQVKVDDESRANNDMRNLLDSTDIATLFLDEDLRVRRYTPQMTKIIKLIPSDVNRLITDLASDLLYPDLVSDAQSVLRTLVAKETQVRTSDARWFSARIMPYRTLDNRIDGVVLTFADITAAKTLEATLRMHQANGAT